LDIAKLAAELKRHRRFRQLSNGSGHEAEKGRSEEEQPDARNIPTSWLNQKKHCGLSHVSWA
jgi:hypothetical protein